MAQATRTLTGVVITTDGGGGVAGATIQIKDKPLTATAAADGTFSLAKVPVGDLVVQVTAEGYIAVEIPVKAGRGNAVFAANLSKQLPPPPPPTRSVTVLVRDSATGLGVANADIKVQGTEIAAQTDGDGLFVLKDITAGDIVLDITAPDHNPSSVTVAAADSSTKVALTSSLAAAPPAAPPAPAAPTLTDEELAALSEAEAEAASNADGEVIVVTGSAIARKELTTAAPVSVIDKADIEATGLTSVGDVLQNLPAQSNAINVQFNNGGDGSTRVNLRGLGASRTLVLLNGRRIVPGGTGADLSVDLNSIPLAIIERVEVLKDGASAVYGSDALGGVVNIITRNDWTGTEVNGQIGTSQEGDGSVYDVSVSTGAQYKRGSVAFSAGYTETQDAFTGDRNYSLSDTDFDFASKEAFTNGSGTTPAGSLNTATAGPGIGTDAWRKVLQACPANSSGSNCYRGDGGVWRRFNGAGNSDVDSDGDGQVDGDLFNFNPDNYLVTPQQRYNVWSSGDFKFNDHMRGFFEASYLSRRSAQKLAPTPLTLAGAGLTLSKDSYYNPFGVDLNTANRRMVEAGRRDFTQDVNTFRIVTGVDGDIPGVKDWNWDVSVNFGRNTANSTNAGQFNSRRLAAALGPSYQAADGSIQCGTGPTDPGPDGCVPLNILGGYDPVNPTITQDMVDYISFTGIDSGFNEQRTLAGNVRGRLLKTPWGGDVSIAAGADYREESAGSTPDPLTAAGDSTGNISLPTSGDYNVKEGFAELSILPIVDNEWAKWLEFNGAARVFDYSSFGSGVTWKAGALYQSPQGISVRGTYSTAFRAPAITELFAGTADSFDSATDPCEPGANGMRATPEIDAKCKELHPGIPDDFNYPFSQILAKTGGNKDLKEETANTFTAGLIYEPTFLPGASLTLDYFNIEIDGTIQREGAQIVVNSCYQYGIDSECAKIVREPDTFYIDTIDDVNQNIGGRSTSGIDFSVAYDHTTAVGRFRHNLEGTWLNSFKNKYPGPTIEGVGNYDLGAFPELKANYSLLWAKGPYNAAGALKYVNAFKECDNNDCSIDGALSREVDMNVTLDLSAGYTVKSAVGRTALTVGVNNVANTDPPLIYNGDYGNSDGSSYDFLGRFFYTRLTQSF
jgi:iron complex outermembrane recepter protein